MIKKMSLSRRIITRVLLFTLFLFLLTLSLAYYFSRETIEESTRENAIFLAENAVANIEKELSVMEQIPRIIATLMEVHPIPEDTIYGLLESILENNPNVSGAAVAFEPYYFPHKGKYFAPYAYREESQILTISLGGETYDYFHMDWYQIPKMLEKPYWSEPYYDEGGGEMLIATYSMPFYSLTDGKRHLSGVATVDISLQWLTEIVAGIEVFQSGYAFMISRNGVAITHPDARYIMNESLFSIAETMNLPELRTIGRDMIAGESAFRRHALYRDGVLWMYHTPLPSMEWSIGVVYPDNEMFAALHRISFIMILLVVVGLILLSILVTQVVNRLAAPLTRFSGSARMIAQGNFDTQLPQVSTTAEIKELHDAFSHMQTELANYMANLKETTAAKEKIESELRIARDIQLSMLPHTFPPFPDLPQIDLFAMLKSAREVGGDLYDFFVKDKDQFYFAIGDVSGKGVPASMFMAMTRTLLRTISDKESEPGTILQALNRALSNNNESNMFVTFFLGVIDLTTGKLKYANAGHNPPVLIRKNGAVEVFPPAGAIPLGLFESFEYQGAHLQLQPGDAVFSYTDGVSEAENQAKELFDEKRMLEVLKKDGHQSPRALIASIEQALNRHVQDYPQSDDITMMSILFKE